MSDISRELVKCAKCGKESQQLVIYSVNYSLGDRQSNDNLVSHMQKCPYCNYEAISIDVIDDNGKNNDKLKREEIIRITDEFIKKINNYDIFKIPNELYLDYFNEMNKCFDKYSFEDDNRFVTYGRLDFLKEELTQRITDEYLKYEDPNWKDKWDNRLGAFIDLSDVIRGNSFFCPHQVPQGMDFKTIFSDNEQYYKDGYICKQEKELILNMINEIKNFINNSLEEKDMGLFNKKNKYDVNAEDNLPQFVYGIPDSMRKQWEKEKEENRKNQKTIFSAFEGGYFGPSYYYFINNYKDSYEFRFGYSEDGRYVKNDENDPNIHIFEQNGEHYKKFMEELLSEIKDWDETYNDPGVMDGTQWNIELIEQNKIYSGSNAFPQNYDKVVAILKKYFNVNYFVKNNEKYDIKPENNVPQRVYGVPNTNIPNLSNNSVIKKSVGVGIKNEKNNYVLSLNYVEKLGTYDLLFADLNNLDGKSISDLATPVPEKYYTDFITKLYSIINDWEDTYLGDSNVSWNIKVDTENSQKNISGKGGYPKNWNKLIDLLSEYERLFKVSKDIELGKIQDMKDAKLSFEEVVKNKVNDPFWVETIVKHFKEEEKMNDVVSKILFKDLSKYDDILNEFTKYLTQRTYEIDGAIEINGYTAKKVSELNPAFHPTGVYTFMELLRDDFNKAEEIIKGGFKNKDVVPPINQSNVKTEKEMLKEIEDEVDQEMIKEGLLRIENGRKIPSFGSIHTRWAIEKRILKEKYNYDYETPAERNPFINYD